MICSTATFACETQKGLWPIPPSPSLPYLANLPASPDHRLHYTSHPPPNTAQLPSPTDQPDPPTPHQPAKPIHPSPPDPTPSPPHTLASPTIHSPHPARAVLRQEASARVVWMLVRGRSWACEPRKESFLKKCDLRLLEQPLFPSSAGSSLGSTFQHFQKSAGSSFAALKMKWGHLALCGVALS